MNCASVSPEKRQYGFKQSAFLLIMCLEANDLLCRQVRGCVLHSTSLTGYRGIRSEGQIFPNTGKFPNSHTQSPISLCRKKGAISLLDLRKTTGYPVNDEYIQWTDLLYNHEPVTILLDIEPSFLIERMPSHDERSKGLEACTYVDEVEWCYPEPISLNAVKRCLLVSGWDPPVFDIFEAILSEDHLVRALNAIQNRADREAAARPMSEAERIASRFNFALLAQDREGE